MEILNDLRKATGPIHARIEQLPICKAVLAGDVERDGYARLLAALYHVHAAYEAALAACPVVAAVWPQTPSRVAALARDLDVFGEAPGDAPECVADWVEQIDALGHPVAWAGVGYVLEGSRMGSRVLVGPLARGLGVEPRLGVGLDYHLDAGADPIGNWRQVMDALAALDSGTAARAAAVAAAVATFEAIYTIHEGVGEPAFQAVH